MMEENLGKINFLYEQISKIMQSINEDKPATTLNESNLLFKLIPHEFKKTHNLLETEKEIKNLLEDHNVMRLIKRIQNVKSEIETSIEYYDEDVGEDERLSYDSEFENLFLKLQEEIRKAIGEITMEYLIEEIDYD